MSSVIVKVTENGTEKTFIRETVNEAMREHGFIPALSTPTEVFENLTIKEVNDG